MKNTNAPKGANTLQNHSTVIQRRKLISALIEAGNKGLTTIECREGLDIMMPAARVHELRHGDGYNIQLVRSLSVNAQGNEHLCGRYILLSGKWQEAA